MREYIFNSLITFLNDSSIDFVILGNSKNYPKSIDSDIDICVSAEIFVELDKVIKLFCERYNYLLCNQFWHEIEGRYYVVSHKNSEHLAFNTLALDFCCNYMRMGRVILKSEVLKHNKQQNYCNEVSFYVPSNDTAFIYYLIKKIEKGSFNQNQFNYLLSLWETSKASILHQLGQHFSSASVVKINTVFENKNVNGFTKELVSDLNKELYVKHKRGIVNEIREFSRKVTRFLNPTGLVITVLGCDGSGKSTVINALINHSADFEAFRGFKYHHLMPEFGTSKKNGPVASPHDQVMRSRMVSDLKLVYFLIKYIFGYWLIIYPQKVRSQLVIFDRYYHDIFVDPRRYRHNGSKWLTKWVAWLIPKPDLFFVIDADVETIQARKQEVSYDECKRQRELYLDLGSSIKNLTVIDNSKDVKLAKFQLQCTIQNYLAQRFNKRYN